MPAFAPGATSPEERLKCKPRVTVLLPSASACRQPDNVPLSPFVGAVGSAGEVTEARRAAFVELITGAGFNAAHVTFVAVFQDRNAAAF